MSTDDVFETLSAFFKRVYGPILAARTKGSESHWIQLRLARCTHNFRSYAAKAGRERNPHRRAAFCRWKETWRRRRDQARVDLTAAWVGEWSDSAEKDRGSLNVTWSHKP